MYGLYAKMYCALLPIYNYVDAITPTCKIEKRFKVEVKQSLNWLLKHCDKLVPSKASRKANKIVERKRVDLFALPWDDQPNADKIISGIDGRDSLIHEHKFPVSGLYYKILECNSEKVISDVLKKQSIVWISRVENINQKNKIEILMRIKLKEWK